MTDDPDDLKLYTVSPEVLAARPAGRAVPKKRRHFVKVPVLWVERLTEARHLATYQLALHLLYRAWKMGSSTVALPNRQLAAEGIRRGAKWRALKDLERLGLVAVERRPRKAPRVTVFL